MQKFIIVLLFLSIINVNQSVQSKETGNKPLLRFEEVDKDSGVYIIRYSNVIDIVDGKQVKVPIYGGIYEDITYEDLEKQQTDKDIDLFGNIYIPVKDGEVKKTFFDILTFYKKSFFKDIDTNRPSVIGNEGGNDMYIWYDFDYDGLPCSMMITVACDPKATAQKYKKMNAGREKEDPIEKTVEMLEFKENSKWIGIRINLGNYSKYKKKSKSITNKN